MSVPRGGLTLSGGRLKPSNPGGWSRRGRSLALAALAALLPGAREAQQKPAPAFDAKLVPAYEGAVAADWQPFVAEVTNLQAADATVTIRLEHADSRTAVRRRETLARGATKRLLLYLPVGEAVSFPQGSEPKLLLLDEQGKEILTRGYASSGHADPDRFQIAVLSGERAGPAAFALAPRVGAREVTELRLTPDTFPDSVLGLRCLDALLLHDAPFERFSPAQARAVADYVRGGGMLLLSPGADPKWFSHPVLAAFVTIRTGPSEERSGLPALDTFALGGLPEQPRFAFHPIANAPGSPGPIPLFEAGFGTVAVFPFDLRRPPFNGWGGMRGLMANVLERARGRHPSEPAGTILPAGGELLQNMSQWINALPPYLLLMILPLLFLAVVGPLNYLVLKRLGMSLLIVVSVPAISALFLGIVVITGYVLKGASTVTLSLRVLTTESGRDSAAETRYFTLFSASNRSYDVDLEPGTGALPYERGELRRALRRYRGGHSVSVEMRDDRLEMESTPEGLRVAGVAVGQWQSRHFVSRTVRDLGGGVRYEWTADDELTVTNLMDRPIRRGACIVDGKSRYSVPFGEVGPGATAKVAVSRKAWLPAEHLAFDSESFGAAVLSESRYWRPDTGTGVVERAYLLCVLDEGPAIRTSARASSRSAALTLLHVAGPKP